MFRQKLLKSHPVILSMLVCLVVMSGCQPVDRARFAKSDNVEAWVPRHIILIGPNKPDPKKVLEQSKGKEGVILGSLDQIASSLGLTEVTADGVTPIELGGLLQRDVASEKNPNAETRSLDDFIARVLLPKHRLNDAQIKRVHEGDLVAKLYDFADSKYWHEESQSDSLLELFKEIEIRWDDFAKAEDGRFAIAQPNYWLAASDVTRTDCHNVFGTPDGGSVITGGALDKPEPSVSGNPGADFDLQPALNRLTISRTLSLEESEMDTNVKIVVFDSSPFSSTTKGENYKTPGTTTKLLHDVKHKNTGTLSSTLLSEVSEHGLFVARLVRAVSPSSDIELVRALDGALCGQLYVLDSAISEVLIDTDDINAPLVLNLSLGYQLNDQNDTLTHILDYLVQSRPNTVIVAAAGNEGNSNPPIFPAAYHLQYPVLAVAGIGENGAASCFSNQGTVSAVAGQGIFPSCGTSMDPKDKVVSILSNGQYAYWSGTSFATPLVSGLVARCLRSGLSAAQTITKLTSGGGQSEVTLDMCPPPN